MKLIQTLKRLALGAVLMTVASGVLAANMLFSTGTGFLPGFRMFDGTDLNIIVTAVNTLIAQAAGTTSGTYTGTFNGTLGATTPNTLVATTGSFSGALTPTGGVASAGGFAFSPRVTAETCAQGAISTTTPGTDTTPVNTETYIAEAFMPANGTVTGVALFNGSAAAGNVKISLANAVSGVPIAAAVTASTAQSGTAAYQLIPFAAPYAAVGPATYLVLVQFDTNTTPRFRTHAIGTCGASKKTGETYGTFTTVTPPTTFTTAVGPMATLY